MSGSIIVSINEVINKEIYRNQITKKPYVVQLFNNIKIGIIYGLFVDAFKLGS